MRNCSMSVSLCRLFETQMEAEQNPSKQTHVYSCNFATMPLLQAIRCGGCHIHRGQAQKFVEVLRCAGSKTAHAATSEAAPSLSVDLKSIHLGIESESLSTLQDLGKRGGVAFVWLLF